MLIFLMPGVVVRMVTISNLALAVPLGVLLGTELWITWERRSPRRLMLCGLLVGCGLLTDLYLVEFVPVAVLVAVVVLWHHRTRRDVLYACGGGVIAFLVVLPWLAFNEAKYHLLFAGPIAKREQLSIVNPHHVYFSANQVPGLTLQYLFGCPRT